jgi:hypothetical protein
MTMRHYCTLFDKNYLVFGLALHESLQRLNLDYRLHILAMDPVCAQTLRTLDLPNVRVIDLEQVIVPAERGILQTMHFGQVCWTCQPLLCKYVLDQGTDGVTYLEADSVFYADPQVLFDEIGPRSVSLVPHNYAPGHDQTATSGIYCVQFNYFRPDEAGYRFLDQWKAACLQYVKNEPKRFPGQTCLDAWPAQSEAVCVIRNPAAGVAPWNHALFKFSAVGGVPHIDGKPVVFFHFHQLSFIDDSTFMAAMYPLDPAVLDLVYRPYVARLKALRADLRARVPGFDYCKRFQAPDVGATLLSFSWPRWRELLRYVYGQVRHRANILRVA